MISTQHGRISRGPLLSRKDYRTEEIEALPDSQHRFGTPISQKNLAVRDVQTQILSRQRPSEECRRLRTSIRMSVFGKLLVTHLVLGIVVVGVMVWLDVIPMAYGMPYLCGVAATSLYTLYVARVATARLGSVDCDSQVNSCHLYRHTA